MKRIIILLILCLLSATMFFSCCCINTISPPEMEPQPSYILEYVKGIYILREVDNG